MAFFGLLSVFPLILAGLTILARFLSHDTRAMTDFTRFISGFFPGAAGAGLEGEIGRAMHSIDASMQMGGATFGALAVASLLWSGRAYFDTLVTVLSRTVPGGAPRSFLKHQLMMWALMLGVGALFVLSSALSLLLAGLQLWAARWPDLPFNSAPLGWKFLGQGTNLALTLLLFWLLFRFAPNRTAPPRRRPILVSTLVASLGWEVGKWIFAHFLGNTMRYQATYGALAGVILTMTWIYFASLIILAGAEAGATFEELRSAAPNAKAPDIESQAKPKDN